MKITTNYEIAVHLHCLWQIPVNVLSLHQASEDVQYTRVVKMQQSFSTSDTARIVKETKFQIQIYPIILPPVCSEVSISVQIETVRLKDAASTAVFFSVLRNF
jgi:ABC-type uncharacterized transport system YnjBCD permease subunit